MSRTDGRAPLLDVDGLEVALRLGDQPTRVVRGVPLRVERGGTLGIVGESGCGKTMTLLALGGLLPDYAEASARSVRWRGREVGLDGLQALRGSALGFVFQDPITALNPLMRVGEQVAEVLRKRGASRRAARADAVALLAEVGVPEPRRRARQYPWELSGGLAQRVLIAVALAPEPDLLIADEPTTAIDASARKRVLELLAELQRARGLSILLVTHDLEVVRACADDIAVMYAGRIVEQGGASAVAAAPRHHYTHALLACTLDPFTDAVLAPISGEPPLPSEVGADCAFRPRCAFSIDECATDPALQGTAPGGDRASACMVACWNPRDAAR